MRSKTRAVIAFAASAVGFALVGFLFDLAFSMSPPPVVLPDRVEIGVVAVLITTLTTVFGVGSMRRPLASLAGIMMLTAIGPIELCGPPATLMFVWTSWLMGALVKFVLFYFKLFRDVRALDAAQKAEGAAKPNGGPVP